MSQKIHKAILSQCINMHWLRPDNALWVYGFYNIFGKLIKNQCKNKISLDLGCGDGTTSFIILGGKTNIGFDVYRSIQSNKYNLNPNLKRLKSGSLRDEKGDFYNFYDNDWSKSFKKSLIKNVEHKFTFGSDWKRALINKSNDLGLYENTKVFDANLIPWKFDIKFEFIFSTIIYWLNNPNKILKEINNNLMNNGIFAFSAPRPQILNYTLHNMLDGTNYKYMNRLDRGRHANWKRHAKNYDYWKQLIVKNGFEIIEYKTFHPSLQIAYGETIFRTLLSSYDVLLNKLKKKNIKIFEEFKSSHCKEYEILLNPFLDQKFTNKFENTYHAFFIKKIDKHS